MVKRIIIVAGAGLLSFCVAFGVAWFMGRPDLIVENNNTVANTAREAALVNNVEVEEAVSVLGGPIKRLEGVTKKSMTEKQLQELIYRVNEKSREYENKLKALESREERLKLAHELLNKDLSELNNLRDELGATVVKIKTLQERLDKSMVEISMIEKNNLVAIAATYDKMKPDSAGEILANMTQMSNIKGAGSIDDVVKILYYMTDKSKAKLLSELSKKRPDLAALICGKLKRVVESN